MVLRSKEGCHLLHIGAVLGGLKCIGTEILSVPGKIEGIRYEFPVLLFQLPGADGGNQGGIYPAGKKGADGNI